MQHRIRKSRWMAKWFSCCNSSTSTISQIGYNRNELCEAPAVLGIHLLIFRGKGLRSTHGLEIFGEYRTSRFECEHE